MPARAPDLPGSPARLDEPLWLPGPRGRVAGVPCRDPAAAGLLHRRAECHSPKLCRVLRRGKKPAEVVVEQMNVDAQSERWRVVPGPPLHLQAQFLAAARAYVEVQLLD
jgi:hypothetical protein